MIRPEPSIRITRGGVLSYNLWVKNHGGDEANQILIYLPYDPNQLTLIGSDFTQPSDWVTEVGRDYIKIRFSTMDENKSRTGTLSMRVADDLPNDTVINMWAGFSWETDTGSSSAKGGNAAPVLVGDTNETSPWIWMAADPVQGRVGTQHTFFSDRFLPNEQIFTWLNTPTGPVGTGFSVDTDGLGRVTFAFDSSTLTPGTYQMVARGEDSELVAVTTFEVMAQ